MKSKTSRTRSSWSTNNLSKKLSLYEQDIQEISRNTIIPFVNSRFSIASTNYISSTGQKKQISSSNGLKLASLIIFHKVQKLSKTLANQILIKLLKTNTFKKKLNAFIHSKSDKIKRDAFKTLINKYFIKMAYEKLILFDFVNRKMIYFQLSYGFRKIIMHSNFNNQKIKQKFQQNNEKSDERENLLQNSQKTIKQRNSYNQNKVEISPILLKQSPAKLKADKINENKNKQYIIWGVNNLISNKFSS